MGTDGILWPREASKYISSQSKDVVICYENIKKVANLIKEGMRSEFKLSDWKKFEINPKVADEAALNWIFFVDSLNFSFWTSDEEKFIITYKNTSYTGYFSLCAAVQRALENGIPLTDPKYYSKVSVDELRDILKSDHGIEIPLLQERLKILHENGKVLLKLFDGSFINCVRATNGKAKSLIKLVTEHFPSYRDEAIYNGHRVALYKRAQILVADIWACFEGKDDGYFEDIDCITMFADYRVPQVLAHFGILKYSEELEKMLKEEKLLKNQERVEVEIRGCSIWAVELIKEELSNVLTTDCASPINSITIDFFLWEYRRKHSEIDEKFPYHRVRCIYY